MAKENPQKIMKKKAPVKVKKKKVCSTGTAHVKATFNNTIITITDHSGNVISFASCGSSGFAGSKKSSSFAAVVAAQNAAKKAISIAGMKEVDVLLNGAGAGRESAVRGLSSGGLTITAIKDKTPVPHNGCRPRKRRRV
ncbi:MAG: 30S ribosomal protein S11 [Chlamydiae bacterium RIFCSPHIGHO2_12_FULL_49_11]|nr:MAG: 30S ribosomal protein S11 [Chlamydiae bacterium RIFCSPHIGHO2_12_FULL_49_11]